MKPITTITEFPEHSWKIILIVAIGLYFEDTVTREWLEREVRESKGINEAKQLEDIDE